MTNLSKQIQALVRYALNNHLMEGDDYEYAINRICDLLELDVFEQSEVEVPLVEEPSVLLQPLLDYAAKQNLINPDTVTRRDIFEAKIMDCVMKRPSDLINDFYSCETSEDATNMYYELSKKSNYIKTSRTNKNIIWKSETKYGVLDMTINLSKPEKDPRDIIAAGKKTNASYPKCLLCKENVGYNGATTNIGRTNHRIIPVELNREAFYLQYSPYVYYNEHCIVLQREHEPMNVTINTFKRLFDFVDTFPHYFLGSNAGLPIVGGSILSHEHYQGGRHHFPIEDAKVIHKFELDGVMFEQLYWPLSVVRISSSNRDKVTAFAKRLFDFWENYSNKEVGIYAETEGTPHNAITPIARIKDGVYQLDMTLRNNLTSNDYPLGIFHPHPENHHIKKENIGLIEVMGLAVLPARLSKELPIIKEAIIENKELPKELSMHNDWLVSLKQYYNNQNIDTFLNDEVAKKFMNCIENAGVFKQDKTGQTQFQNFMKELQDELNK